MAEIFFYIGIGTTIGFISFWWIKNKQEHRDEPWAVTDLLNYHFFETNDEGIVRLKDGGLLAMYEYRGPDLSHQTIDMQDNLSMVMHRFLSRYENNWAFYFSGQRAELKDYPTGGEYNEPVNLLIDQNRKDRFSSGKSYYTNRYVFSVVWKPEHDGKLETFKTYLTEIEEELNQFLNLKRLSSDQVLSELYYCLNGIRQEVNSPKESDIIDGIIGNQDIFRIPGKDETASRFYEFLEIPNYYQLKIGEKYVGAITITGLPFYTSAGLFDLLNQLDVEYRYSTRIITMDRSDQEKKIDKVREMYRWGRKSPSELVSTSEGEANEKVKEAYENKHVLSMMNEAGDALSEIQGNLDSFAQVTSTFIIYSDNTNNLKNDAQRIISQIRKVGCTAVQERIQPLKALIGTLPGHSENIRRNFMSCKNIADMIPTWGVWTGEEINTSTYMANAPAHWIGVSNKGQPFIKQQPVKGDVGHKLILGPTGSGKSTFINFEISQWFRMKNAQVYLFDKGYSGEVLCKATGGSHYNIGGESGLKFQPLRDIEGKEVWFTNWLEMIVELQNVSLTAPQKKEIRRAVYSMKSIPPERRTLTEFVIQIQDQKVSQALQVYTKRGKYDVLDANNDSIEENPYQVFEMETLLEMRDEILLPVLDYLFYRVEQSLSKEKPTLIYIEEAWKAFRQRQFSDRLKQWLRELRKKNAHVGLITQSPQDILKFDDPTLFLSSCPEKIFLANPNAGSELYRDIYTLFNLNETQIKIIKEAIPKRQYYIHTPYGSSLVDLKLDKTALGFLGDESGLSDKEKTKKIADLKSIYSDNWPVEWLKLQDLHEPARVLYNNINNNNPRHEKTG